MDITKLAINMAVSTKMADIFQASVVDASTSESWQPSSKLQ